jgi:hypothetical protein
MPMKKIFLILVLLVFSGNRSNNISAAAEPTAERTTAEGERGLSPKFTNIF